MNYDEARDWIGDQSSSLLFDEKVKDLLSDQPSYSTADVYFRTKRYTEKLLNESLSLAIKTELLPPKLEGSTT